MVKTLEIESRIIKTHPGATNPMDIVLAVVREVIVLQCREMSETMKKGGTNDDIAYILDVFHQEANVQLTR